jgi:hypothetical protein
LRTRINQHNDKEELVEDLWTLKNLMEFRRRWKNSGLRKCNSKECKDSFCGVLTIRAEVTLQA